MRIHVHFIQALMALLLMFAQMTVSMKSHTPLSCLLTPQEQGPR